MEISNVNKSDQTYNTSISNKGESKQKTTTQDVVEEMTDSGVVYEKSDTKSTNSANTIYNKDTVVAKLKADQQSRIDSMQSLVEKLLTKQAGTFDLSTATNLADTFRQASQVADPETVKSAQDAVSEDGYWGVDQTSDRLVSMAIALSGGDTSKADDLMSAIQKGYEKATAAWGEDLPKICQDTLTATTKKMDDWKNGVTTAADYSDYLTN